jgi:glycosyltransferase involved in cell wall biosynthesis
MTHPLAYLGTLREALAAAHAGGRARLWQLFYFAEAMLFWRWMRGRRVRHVHVHHANVSSDVAMIACAYANRAGASPRWTWSLTVHGPTDFYDVEALKLPRKLQEASAVVCISDFTRSQAAAFMSSTDVGKLHTVRCGIDLSEFSPAPDRGDESSAEILSVGALHRRKGNVVLLDAFARVLAAVPEARLTIAGDGEERLFLERRAEELGVAHAVRFLGAVEHDRLPQLYAGADVFCLPSFAEGLPVVLMEAMSTGVPVVATSIMGVPELVRDGESGLLVPPARADALAEALIRLLRDPELRRRLAAEGRRRVAGDYDRTATSTELREVLLPLIS